MPELRVCPATSLEHRRGVFRLRYDVYVNEMGRPQKYADHPRGEIEEPMDATGHIVAAFCGSDLVGTVRTNLLRLTCSTGLYEDLYGFTGMGLEARNYLSLTTKLIVRRDFRNTSLALRLARAAYLYALSNGVEEDFIDCNAHLVHLFQRLGYITVRPITHPEYGIVTLLRIKLRDDAHLSTMHSPFLKDLRSFEQHCRERAK